MPPIESSLSACFQRSCMIGIDAGSGSRLGPLPPPLKLPPPALTPSSASASRASLPTKLRGPCTMIIPTAPASARAAALVAKLIASKPNCGRPSPRAANTLASFMISSAALGSSTFQNTSPSSLVSTKGAA